MRMMTRDLTVNGPFLLESGRSLASLQLRYTTLGAFNPEGSRVVWIFHPLTCDSNPTHWWPGLIGEGRVLDPRKYFIVCVNALGSCYGSTGPKSCDENGQIYGQRFPLITMKDIIRAFQHVKDSLGIQRIHLGIGGSFGGQQLLEWLADDPALFEKACVIGANARQSPWAIAFHESQRMALEADPEFAATRPGAGAKGLAAARSMAVLSYRSYETYRKTQAEELDDKFDHFKAASYQRYIGNKFTDRFDAQSYWYLTKAMDSHNVARSRAAYAEVLASITTRTLVLSLRGDVLFPEAELEEMAALLPNAQLYSIDSTHGHDGILANAGVIFERVDTFLKEGHSLNNRI